MFEIGTNVTYGAHGVYTVEDIRLEDFLGEKKKYYVLCDANRKNRDRVFVPCDNEYLVSQMKKILSKDEVLALIASVPAAPMEWIEDNRARSEHFKEILSRADRRELLHMAKTIYLRKALLASHGKRIFISDENILARAEKALFDEFAFVLGISLEEVLPFVIEHSKS